MGSDGISKRLVAGHPCRIERREAQVDEAGALRIGDRQPTVDLDEMRESEFPAEPIGSTE